MYSEAGRDKPLWLHLTFIFQAIYYMQRAVSQDLNFIMDIIRVSTLSQIIGVPVKDIVAYVHGKQDKGEEQQGRKDACVEYSGTLDRVCCAEI